MNPGAPECTAVVDHALRSIRLAATHRAALVLCGEPDLVPIARALHRRSLGNDPPFVLCDPRREDTSASVRSPMNHENGVMAFRAAIGGSLCVRSHRLPGDFSSLVARVREPAAHVQLIVCAKQWNTSNAFLAVPVPIHLPPLRNRTNEVSRIVDEYARDAIAELGTLGGRDTCFTDEDRAWVCEHGSSSLSEIEKSTRRLVAVRTSRNMHIAAERLGMAQVSLKKWLDRRTPPRRS